MIDLPPNITEEEKARIEQEHANDVAFKRENPQTKTQGRSVLNVSTIEHA